MQKDLTFKLYLKPKKQLKYFKKLSNNKKNYNCIKINFLSLYKVEKKILCDGPLSMKNYGGTPTQYLKILSRTVKIEFKNFLYYFTNFEINLLKNLTRQSNVLEKIKIHVTREGTSLLRQLNNEKLISVIGCCLPINVNVEDLVSSYNKLTQPNVIYFPFSYAVSSTEITHLIKFLMSENKVKYFDNQNLNYSTPSFSILKLLATEYYRMSKNMTALRSNLEDSNSDKLLEHAKRVSKLLE